MEPFQFTKLSGSETSYDLEISGPYESEESHTETKSTPDFIENIELPLPPGISGDELFESLGFKPGVFETSKIVQPISNEIKFKSNSFDPTFLTYGPQLPSNYKDILENQKANEYGSDSIVCSGKKISEYLGENRYSPSKVDSDEENQDVTSKPKVLGKEQAKKRLMAFSVAKLSATALKKQNKTTPAKSKEKPPNPNKGTNFQEQFRATISAIEEEKKKIYQNMPDYLLQEMKELVKGHIVSSPNIKSSDKKNADSKRMDKSPRHDCISNKPNERRRNTRRSLSRSSSRTRRRDRRSRSRSNGTHNKSSKRSWSRNRRSRSPGKKSQEKSVKSELSKSGKNEKDFVPKKETFEDWKSFKNSGAAVENDSIILKNEFQESEGQEPELDTMSHDFRSHYKPVFDYLKKSYHKMTPLRAKPASPNSGKSAIFAEKTIKFTRTKPTIIWTENPSLATDYYMSKEILLENCPSASNSILCFIIEGKSSELNTDDLQKSPTKSRSWYPREKYLCAVSPCSTEKTESPPQKSSLENQSKDLDVETSKGKISLVDEDYLSDEVGEEITVDGIKVQLDLEMNTVKVRSKWDSDIEDVNNEKESGHHKIRSKETPREEKIKKSKGDLISDFDVEPLHGFPEEKPQFLSESPSGRNTNSHPGYLASEYEEFLKMVSFDSRDSPTVKISQCDNIKPENMKIEKPGLESDKDLKFSIDWDRESEQEEPKVSTEKFETSEKLFKSAKPKKKKNKMEKPKPKKKEIVKKLSKLKKDTYESSYSDDSSSSESESDSDSDSSKSKSSREKKGKRSERRRKKLLKEKKKFKKYFSDKSESNSDGGKPRKKKSKRKKGSSDSDGSQNKMLKQIDLKKQLIMKKVEEIDIVMEKIDRKKGKENETKKEYFEKDKSLKPDKKKNKAKSIKKSKVKKFRKTETDSDSVSSGESVKKKEKKEMKKKRFSSDSSDSEEETKASKTKSSKYKKAKKEKKKKGRKYSSSSESDESSDSKKWKKRKKEDSNPGKNFKSSILPKETELKVEERLIERGRKMLKKKEKKTKKEDDDWDTSSSLVESEPECESSWDEEVKVAVRVPEIDSMKQKEVEAVVPEKEGGEKNLAPEGNLNSGSETLKNSLSNFSFNENSFCGFGQELSRDFFLTERSFSSSANIGTCENAGPTPIDARPFQCIGKGGEKRAIDSELYSPGCSDSEMSDVEGKSQKSKTGSSAKDVYDPLNCESEGSADNNEVEISTIPLPTVADISLPEEVKPLNFCMSPPPKVNNEVEKTLPSTTPPLKFIPNEFSLISNPPLNENSPKKQIMNFKNQQMLKTKAASVFQDDSDEENKEPEKSKEEDKHKKTDKETGEKKRSKKETLDESRERDRKRSRSRERRIKKSPCETVEASKREIRSDSFEIEPLKSVTDEAVESVQPIPVLLGVSSNRVWSGSLPGYEFPQVSDSLIDQAESFDIYPSEESKYPSEDYTCDLSVDKSGKKRKSRSKSLSPKKKRKSKSPIRRRSPKRWSVSPKHRDKSPRSPRRRSPKRKSPPRRRSRSPSRRKKSRRLSSPRRSRSKSPMKRRSPKRWDSPPRRKDSPSRGYSPRRDSHYSSYSDRPYWVPAVGRSEKNEDMQVSPPGGCSPHYDNSMPFPRMSAPSVSEAEMNNSFYEGEYANEYGGVNNYREEIGMNNLITVKNHSVEKVESPKRPSLDQRIELELGSPISSNSLQFSVPNQPPQTFEAADPNRYQTYSCDNSGPSENFYQNQTVSDFNGQYFNEVQPSNYGSYPYPHPHPQPQPQPPPVQNAVMQVGNIVEVVPTLQHTLLPPPSTPSKAPQIMQVGNVLQVVPTQKITTPAPVPPPVLDHDSLPSSPVVKTQKATAVVAPSSVVPPPNLEAMINPLIKAILLEREKRSKAKEKRRLEREARRKARQLRREAKLMSVSEKLKKSVQNEGLVLGQEVEDDELLDAMDIPSPPVPVQIITVSSPSAASPAGKGILITAGFVSKSPSKKKEVKFADGVYPGEGTSSSGEEDVPLSPPKPKLPKEKPFKKKKIKVKKKVKVHIIKQILHEEEEDEDDDNLSPPPPPPGDPPPVFFARFPFAGNAQFPVYQTQTTTTTTVQYPTQAIQ